MIELQKRAMTGTTLTLNEKDTNSDQEQSFDIVEQLLTKDLDYTMEDDVEEETGKDEQELEEDLATRRELEDGDVLVAGPAGGIYDDDLFANERGEATVFIPYIGESQAIGRVRPTVIPAAELASVTHQGPVEGLDLAYGALAAHIARHDLGVAGPIREYYTVADTDTPDSSAWRTEIGLPIFSTGQPA